MKKIILMMSVILVFAVTAMGCSNNHTTTEQELINVATSLIEEKYEVELNIDDYTYSLGEVVSDDSFVNIKEGETPEVVFLRAVNKEKPTSGKVFDYSIKFNTQTNEIISSECGVY